MKIIPRTPSTQTLGVQGKRDKNIKYKKKKFFQMEEISNEESFFLQLRRKGEFSIPS